MYRSSVLFYLLAFLGIAALCIGAPLDKNVRHNGVEHSSEGAGHSDEIPAAMPSEDHSSHGDSHHDADMPDMENSEIETPEMEQPASEKPSEDHSSHGADKAEAEKPSHADDGHGSHMPDGEMPSHGDGSHASHGGETPEDIPGPIGSAGSDDDNMAMEESAEPEVSPSPVAESGVCIAVNMLGNFESHELVFEKHILSRVLCDAAGSCATKGHIVNFNGKGMMMASYCDIVGCKESVMEVNSPKYSRGLQVQSRSEGMHFTAFAAKYETRGEEAVLSAAVRVGL